MLFEGHISPKKQTILTSLSLSTVSPLGAFFLPAYIPPVHGCGDGSHAQMGWPASCMSPGLSTLYRLSLSDYWTVGLYFPENSFLLTTTLEEQKRFYLREDQVLMYLFRGCGWGKSHEVPYKVGINPCPRVLQARFGMGVLPQQAALDHGDCFKNPCRLRHRDLWVSLWPIY